MKPVGFVLGDSVPLPRSFEPSSPILTETWPYLLAEEMPNWHWIVNCRGSRSTSDIDQVLRTVVNYYRPQVTLISVGIVDCAYRTLKQRELDFVKTVPFLSHLVHPIIRRFHYQITEMRRVPYTTRADFRTRLASAVKFCAGIGTQLLCMQILPAGERMRSVSFDIEKNIAAYNQIFADLLPPEQIIDLSPLTPQIDSLLLADGHHLNAAGHRACADLILVRLKKLGYI